MTIGYREIDIAHLATLQRRAGEVGIGGTLEGVGTALGDGIHATARKSALAHIVRGDRDGHLVEGVDRDWRTATWQRTGFHTEGVVERGTIDGDARLAVVTTTNGHTAGRA